MRTHDVAVKEGCVAHEQTSMRTNNFADCRADLLHLADDKVPVVTLLGAVWWEPVPAARPQQRGSVWGGRGEVCGVMAGSVCLFVCARHTQFDETR